MLEDEDPLDSLLCELDLETLDPNKLPAEVDNIKSSDLVVNDNFSVVHSGDTDSSDDEENRNFEEQKYNESGKQIKHLLDTDPPEISPGFYGQPKKRVSTWNNKGKAPLPKKLEKPQDILIDPFFGIRIVNPLISSTMLKEKMEGREAVAFSRIARYVMVNAKDKDWVICGVVIAKSPVKTSQKGSQYSIWNLTDLKGDIKTVTLFMFSSAHKNLWKTAIGTVIGVLNPNVLEKKDNSKDEATLSVDNAQKVMIFGHSKDFGTCKNMKKSGERCNAVVNLNSCEYCIYHIKQEYQKCSKRSELQANFSGKGLTALRNKVLGKNEVFYAGKSFTAIPARKSKKLEQKDENILKNLSGAAVNSNPAPRTRNVQKKKGSAMHLDVNPAQRKRDIELLKKLGGSVDLENKNNFSGVLSSHVNVEDSRMAAVNVISKLKAKQSKVQSPKISSSYDLIVNGEGENKLNGVVSQTISLEKSKTNALSVISKLKNESIKSPTANRTPTLPSFGMIDLNKPIKRTEKAKLNALHYIQKNGQIKKTDPNSTKNLGKKRKVDQTEDTDSPAKKSKLQESEFISDRFKKMMAATSSHMDLLEDYDNEEKDKYFKKLEIKENMEEKMANTFKVACKAVKCLKCKYTNFSASDLCKNEKHPLKVFDATKRFFKCGHCQNRTATLEVFPIKPCNNCSSTKWEKTGMMKEKIVGVQQSLSIRGGEQKFINSNAADANLDLLVPET